MASTKQRLLYLVRHGETQSNARGVLQGALDSPLTRRGRQQALDVAAALRARNVLPALMLASPQGRAQTTLEIIREALPALKGVPARIEPCLAEMNYGTCQGVPLASLPFDPWMPKDGAARFGGETGREVQLRALGGLLGVMDKASGNVLAVSHGTVMSHLLEALEPGGEAPPTIENGCILVLSYNQTARSLALIESVAVPCR
mgnify:FL=1